MSKELVLYFSVYGTAKNVAEEIAKQTGADLREIVPAVPYDGNRDHYPALLRVAQKEHDTDARPGIKEELPIAEYDRIYLGYCSIQARAGMYPKTLQYLMGHSDIGVTMNTYTHLGLEDALEEVGRMQELENARKEQEKLAGKKEETKVSKRMFRAG